MYVFVSHSSKDNDIVKGVVSALEKYNIPYWLDSNEIKYGMKIASSIEQGIDNCTHFFLVWSKDAKKSDKTKGIAAEIAQIQIPQYKNKFKIMLRKDDAIPPFGFADDKYGRISVNNAENITSRVIEEQRPSIEKQFSEFKRDVVHDYEKFESRKKSKIKNFKKFDGYNYYVSQDYVELSNEEKSGVKDIAAFVWDEISDKTPKILPIVAEYGSGKSSLCHNIMYKLCNEKDIFPIFIPLGDIEKNENGYTFDSLKEEIFRFVIKEYHFMISKCEFDFRLSQGNFIFILDALDEMSLKVNDVLAQNNLEQIIKLSKKNIVLVTSRYNYISGTIEKQLIQNQKLLLLKEFDDTKRDNFLEKKFPQKKSMKDNIVEIIVKNKIEDIAKKPLFLDIICNNLGKFQNESSNKIVNEATIMQMLTNNWIKYDVQNNVSKNNQETKMHYRQRCSEILAVSEHQNDNNPISKSDIEKQVRMELGFENDVQLDEYFKDARDCTFLVPHENNSFKYILNPIKEYFVARRILNDINVDDYRRTIKDIKKTLSKEIFLFINKIIEVEWAIQPHVFSDEEITTNPNLEKYKNNDNNIFTILKKAQQEKNWESDLSALINILNESGNLSKKKIDFSNLNLKGADLQGVNLQKANLQKANLKGANLKGADLQKANLKGADLKGADLKGADLKGADLQVANLYVVHLQGANLQGVNLQGAHLQGANLPGANLHEAYLQGANLQRAHLQGADLQGAHLQGADLQGAHLHETNLQKADLQGADLQGADLQGAHLQGADLRNITNLPISPEEAKKRGAKI